jgi:hypothetical protein
MCFSPALKNGPQKFILEGVKMLPLHPVASIVGTGELQQPPFVVLSWHSLIKHHYHGRVSWEVVLQYFDTIFIPHKSVM